MIPTRKQFAEEARRMKALRREGWTESQIKGWLIGWRKPARSTS